MNRTAKRLEKIVMNLVSRDMTSSVKDVLPAYSYIDFKGVSSQGLSFSVNLDSKSKYVTISDILLNEKKLLRVADDFEGYISKRVPVKKRYSSDSITVRTSGSHVIYNIYFSCILVNRTEENFLILEEILRELK